jgi:hypothetical protein
MAELIVQTDLFTPGHWTLQSANLSALAATSDALVQALGLHSDALSVWGRHYDEQNERAEDAYINERQIIGPSARVDVIALPREPRPNFVWIDRLHVVAGAASPSVGSQLLGLYVGSNGRMVQAIHHPSVGPVVHHALLAMPDSAGRDWNTAALVDQCRAVLSYDGEQPGALQVRAPQQMAQPVNDALIRLQQLVAGW